MSEAITALDPPVHDDPHDPAGGRIEIRLLGALRVRRTDGSLVHAREWRTGKTADLVRLLALRAGEAVPADTLIDALWPYADAQRGRASLRTAASQVRRVLGPDCLHRRFGGLELRDVWVDAVAFSSLVREVRRLADAGQAARAVTVAREADALYLDDFRAHGGGEEWALTERVNLATAYRGLICDAADAAVELGWMRDAVEFAGRAVAMDRFSERAYRALMQAYAGLGETPHALREYESCRAFLAEELGADPSPQTQALHLQLLTATTAAPTTPPFVGRHEEMDLLKRAHQTVVADRESALVALVGSCGSGKTRLVAEAFRDVGALVTTVSCQSVDDGRVDRVERALTGVVAPRSDAGLPNVVVLEDVDVASPASVQCVVDMVCGAPEPALIVLMAGRAVDDGALARLLPPSPAPVVRGASRSRVLHVPPLSREDLAWLAGEMLAGDATPQLVGALLIESEGSPGRVVATLRGWSRAGRIAATAEGLALMPRGGVRPAEHATRQLAPLLEQLGPCDLSVLQLLAVLARPADPSVIVPLLDDGQGSEHTERLRAGVQSALDRLVDLSIVTPQPAGYLFRDELLRDAVRSWLRPTARRDLHRRVAERGFIPSADRVDHWLKAGETQLGRAAALAAAAEATAEARYDDARSHLIRVCSLGAMPETLPSDRVDLFERLGDVCGLLGRRDEARAAFSVAVSVSRSFALPDLARVAAKRERVCGSNWVEDPSLRAQIPAQAAGVDGDLDDLSDLGPAAEERLREALELADRENDPLARVEARLRLSTSLCTPRRRFGRGRLWAQEAASITLDPRLRARALLATWLPGVLLGDAALAEQPLEQARELAGRTDDRNLQRRIDVLHCLIAHDLGRTDLEEHGADASVKGDLAIDRYWPWITVRIATERGDLVTAERADALAVTSINPLARALRTLATAALRAEQGRADEAMDLLRWVIDAQISEGASLLLPEAFARLIVLQAPHDLPTAKTDFDRLDRAVGADHGFPREQCFRLLARAAIRAANGEFDRAAAAATNAADVAATSGLPFLSEQAERARTIYSFDDGRRSAVSQERASTSIGRSRSKAAAAAL